MKKLTTLFILVFLAVGLFAEPKFPKYNITDDDDVPYVYVKDEYELIDNRFYIVGRKDKRDDQRKELSEIIKDIDTDKYIIVMDHQPADYQKESETAADLVLSGHTHGGQFFPVTYVGEWFGLNDRTYGYEKRNDTEFIVTSGISCWALAFKTGTKSEYVIIDVAQ